MIPSPPPPPTLTARQAEIAGDTLFVRYQPCAAAPTFVSGGAMIGNGPLPPTPRQYEIAAMIADGLSRQQIAVALGITPDTVKRHIENLALRVPGPGPLQVRITRYVMRRRLEHDQREEAA